MAQIIPKVRFGKRYIYIEAVLPVQDDFCEVLLPTPMRVISTVMTEQGASSAATVTVAGSISWSPQADLTLHSITTLKLVQTSTTHAVRSVKMTLTSLTGAGGMEVVLIGTET